MRRTLLALLLPPLFGVVALIALIPVTRPGSPGASPALSDRPPAPTARVIPTTSHRLVKVVGTDNGKGLNLRVSPGWDSPIIANSVVPEATILPLAGADVVVDDLVWKQVTWQRRDADANLVASVGWLPARFLVNV